MKPFLAQFFESGETSTAQTLVTQTMTHVLNVGVDDDEDRLPVFTPGDGGAGQPPRPHFFESRVL